MTPRITPDGDAVGVGLVNALKARAVVMWRMHADVMPDEAAAMTVLALADLHDAAGQAGVPWTLMLDEFGAVIKMAASRAVAILQRGRSHGGQVIVVTQSVADPEALSGQPGLLPSLTDNFSGVVAHRQTAPESRDWLAKLMGTRALWQSTNQTTGHGSQHSGRGSARRVREFRIGSDTFAELSRGEAIIYTTLGPDPRRTTILPVEFDSTVSRSGSEAGRHPCELRVHPEERLPAATSAAGRRGCADGARSSQRTVLSLRPRGAEDWGRDLTLARRGSLCGPWCESCSHFSAGRAARRLCSSRSLRTRTPSAAASSEVATLGRDGQFLVVTASAMKRQHAVRWS